MKNRREFLRSAALVTAAASVGPVGTTMAAAAAVSPPAGNDSRAYWVNMLQRVAQPVLSNLAENKLRQRMPVECVAGKEADRRTVTYLEAFGRTLSGIAPWLELADKPAAEAEKGKQLAQWARQGLDHATDPNSPDYMNFSRGGQPLVDAAFLSHALLRSPNELWHKLEPAVGKRVIQCLEETRKIKPGNNNWLLFSAMVETFLASAGAQWQAEPIDLALTKHQEWYKGDGSYGDGPDYHWDYYNSFVIQPFLVDVLEQMAKVTPRWSDLLPTVLRRARRYAAVQERLIAPDGSFPAIGRSLAYRCGAFQVLAQMALRGQLPDGVTPAQVRSALSAVIARTLGAPGAFDAEGWLTIGLCGHQPGLGEAYISTGSTYLCTFAFLPLGLEAGNPFWSDPPADWTARKVWSGKNLPTDHAIGR